MYVCLCVHMFVCLFVLYIFYYISIVFPCVLVGTKKFLLYLNFRISYLHLYTFIFNRFIPSKTWSNLCANMYTPPFLNKNWHFPRFTNPNFNTYKAKKFVFKFFPLLLVIYSRFTISLYLF